MSILMCMMLAGASISADAPTMEILEVAGDLPHVRAVEAVTAGPKHHFFGYYGINPWDASGDHLLCLETEFGDRAVGPEDTAALMLVNLATWATQPVAVTHAWNFQQGCLAHWLPSAPDRKIIYNDRLDGALKSVILDVVSGERRELPRPVAAVSHDGKLAASINYARLATTRPGYGYVGVADPWAKEAQPKDDGLYVMDLDTAEVKLIASIERVFQATPVPEPYRGKPMWLNHVVFSRDDGRIFFLGRFQPDIPGPLVTAAFTINPDGSDLRCVLPYRWGASHFDWLDDRRLVVVSRYREGPKWLHVFFENGAPLESYTALVPEVLQSDGHCHFSQDGRYMLTDSYPSGANRMQRLYIMERATSQIAEVARFHQPPNYKGEYRCDLHPRWSRDNRRICIDSTHDGTRQVYMVELAFPEGAPTQ